MSNICKIRELFEVICTCPTQANNNVRKKIFLIEVDDPLRKKSTPGRTWNKIMAIDLKKSDLFKYIGERWIGMQKYGSCGRLHLMTTMAHELQGTV